MERFDVYLEFVDFKKFGRLPSIFSDDACHIFNRYENKDCLRRERVKSCWVTNAKSSAIVLGAVPKNWALDLPVYENAL